MCIYFFVHSLFVVPQDAHNCIPEFDEETAMFSVYDGHGGKIHTYCTVETKLFSLLWVTLF